MYAGHQGPIGLSQPSRNTPQKVHCGCKFWAHYIIGKGLGFFLYDPTHAHTSLGSLLSSYLHMQEGEGEREERKEKERKGSMTDQKN